MKPILEVRRLTKRFGGLVAVSDLDFTVNEGEILGLIGPNGAGKSTTFNVIAGTYGADAGEVRFAGRADPRPASAPHRGARHHAHVPAQPALCGHARDRQRAGRRAHPLLYRPDEITRGSRDGGRRGAPPPRRGAVDFVGLAEARDADVGTLSFGQGRLLEIARALAGEPRLILFDEPAAGLTPAELERLAAIIRGIAGRGIAVLLIEHDMRFLLPLAHRVAVLNFGRKIADGLPHEIRAHAAVMEAYLGDATAV